MREKKRKEKKLSQFFFVFGLWGQSNLSVFLNDHFLSTTNVNLDLNMKA